MDIILCIKKEIYPHEIRFGIGIGAITTQINHEFALGADGPSYHKARNCIETLKKVGETKGGCIYRYHNWNR